jgi:hypothetical protein
LKTAEDIRSDFSVRYPDVDNDEFSIEHSGFIHEHPMTAIGVVLISSIVLGTTDPGTLAEFTRYSERFIRAIAGNMENSLLWRDGQYDCSSWYSGGLLPRDEREDREFWEHIQIADGSMWTRDAKTTNSEDAGAIFWNTKLVDRELSSANVMVMGSPLIAVARRQNYH